MYLNVVLMKKLILKIITRVSLGAPHMWSCARLKRKSEEEYTGKKMKKTFCKVTVIFLRQVCFYAS